MARAKHLGPNLVLAGVLLLAGYVLMHAGRDTTFYFDDWTFVTGRDEWRPYTFLAPHNEHLSAIPVLIYKVLFETVGLDGYWAYRAVLTLLVLLCGALTFLYARPRVGPWPGIALAACVTMMGAGYFDLLWAFQMGFAASFAAGIGALLLLDRTSRRSDMAATALLTASVASSSMGIPFLAGAIVEVAAGAERRRRWWVVGVPLVLYGLWYLRYGKSAAQLSNLEAVPAWIRESLVQATGAATGLGVAYGPVLAVLLVAAVAVALSRGAGRVDLRLLGVCAVALALWTLTPLARADEGVTAAEARYLWPGGVLVLLVAVQALRGHRLRGRAAVVVTAIVAFCATVSAVGLKPGAEQLRTLSADARATLAMVELADPAQLPYDAKPLTVQPTITIGEYAEAVRHYGSSPAYSLDELSTAPAHARATADERLWSLVGIALAEAPARAGGCTERPATTTADAEGELPDEGVVVVAGDAPVELRLRRFATGYPEAAVLTVPARTRSLLRLRAVPAPDPWRVAARSKAPFRTCGA